MIAITIILILLAAIILISYITYLITFYASDKRKARPNPLPRNEQYEPYAEIMASLKKELENIPCKEICVTAHDGIKLTGKYYHVKDGAPLQIQFHGYRGNGIRDFCGGNKLARESGQNTLIIDQRAHGRSGGNTITFGIKERIDCLTWVRYANEHFGNIPIYLSGVSMGGATVLMASELDLPENVIGIIADCPYSSPEAIIKKVCRDKGFPPALTYPLIFLGALIFGRTRLNSSSALSAVRRSKTPILMIHGEDDRFVPCEMSKEIADACASSITLLTFPNAAHGISYLTDPLRYKKAVDDFILSCEETQKAKARRINM